MFNGKIYSTQTVVFWDIQDCPIPDNIEAYDVSWRIREALKEMGNRATVELMAYGDYDHLSKDEFDGFYKCYVPAAKDERLQQIFVDLFGYRINNGVAPINFVLILGDISGQMDLISAIHLLKSRRGCNVYLAQPQNASGQLGSTDWFRASLSLGEELINRNRTSDDDNMGSWISSLTSY